MYQSYVIVRYYTCAKKQTNRRESNYHKKLCLCVLWFDILILYTSFSRDLYIAKNQKLSQNQNSKWRNFAMTFIPNLVSITDTVFPHICMPNPSASSNIFCPCSKFFDCVQYFLNVFKYF